MRLVRIQGQRAYFKKYDISILRDQSGLWRNRQRGAGVDGLAPTWQYL